MNKTLLKKPNTFIFTYFCIFLTALCLIFPGTTDAAKTKDRKYIYHVYWSGIKAANATLEFKNTIEGFTVKTHASSTDIISLFYKVDDTAKSIMYTSGYPKSYEMKISEASYKRHRTTKFIMPSAEEPYRIIYDDKTKNDTAEFKVEKPYHDNLSAFYEMTRRPLIVGQSQYIDIFDKKKLFSTEIQVLRKETVNVPAGKFDTVVIKPILKTAGIFNRKGDLHIWVSDDDRKIPVILKSKVKLGSFTAKLIKYE